jgi:hypothetical protein
VAINFAKLPESFALAPRPTPAPANPN